MSDLDVYLLICFSYTAGLITGTFILARRKPNKENI